MRNLKLSGCGTALVTPFRDGEVDYDTYVRLIDRQVKAGIHFLVPLGTTGETPCLEISERLRILELTMEHASGRPVVVGGGTNSLAQTLSGIRQLDKYGPDAYLIVVPYYNKPTQAGMYEYFKAVAESTDKGIVLYNVPAVVLAVCVLTLTIVYGALVNRALDGVGEGYTYKAGVSAAMICCVVFSALSVVQAVVFRLLGGALSQSAADDMTVYATYNPQNGTGAVRPADPAMPDHASPSEWQESAAPPDTSDT